MASLSKGLASTSIPRIQFESRAMFLLDPGSHLEYRANSAIHCCHKLLLACRERPRMLPSRHPSIESKGSPPHPSPNLHVDYFYETSEEEKLKQNSSMMLLTKYMYVCVCFTILIYSQKPETVSSITQ